MDERLSSPVSLLPLLGLLACRIELGPPGARTDGERPTVWVYTAIYQDQVDRFDALAEKELPDIDVVWFQGGSEKVSQRWEAEHAAGGSPACVLATSAPAWYVELTERGLLQPYVSPRALLLDRAWVTETYTAQRIDLMVLGAQNGVTDVPRSFKALAEPAYKGRFSSGDPFSSGTSFTTVSAWNLLYGDAFLEALDQNGWVMAGGNSAVLGRIESGEKPFGVVLLNNLLTRPGATQIVYPEDGAVAIPGPVAIPTDCPEPEAAERVVDWMLGPSAQALVVEAQMHSPFPGAPPPTGAPPLEEIKLMPVPADFDTASAHAGPALRQKLEALQK